MSYAWSQRSGRHLERRSKRTGKEWLSQVRDGGINTKLTRKRLNARIFMVCANKLSRFHELVPNDRRTFANTARNICVVSMPVLVL